jgi:predicted transglutaminase-like cysteine proteinase
MTRSWAVGAALLALVPQAGNAAAAGAETAASAERHGSRSAKVHGPALPPLGFVRFCGRTPLACRRERNGLSRLHMSEDRWRLAYRVNSFINARVAPLSDEELYGEAEYWAYADDAGDCEDYALLKQRYLEHLGFPRSALLLTVVLDEKQEGHALLTIVTSEGDFILDNRTNQIRSWEATDYTFLKRQSRYDPRKWVSLTPRNETSPRNTAAEGHP